MNLIFIIHYRLFFVPHLTFFLFPERQIGDLTTSRVSASPGTTPAPTTGEASGPGQEGAETETVDPPTAEERSADRKE